MPATLPEPLSPLPWGFIELEVDLHPCLSFNPNHLPNLGLNCWEMFKPVHSLWLPSAPQTHAPSSVFLILPNNAVIQQMVRYSTKYPLQLTTTPRLATAYTDKFEWLVQFPVYVPVGMGVSFFHSLQPAICCAHWVEMEHHLGP